MILICFILCLVACYLLIGQITIQNIILKIAVSVFVAMSFLSLSFSLFLFAGINFIIFEVCLIVLPLLIIVQKLKKSQRENVFFKSLKGFPFPVLVTILLGILLFSYRFFTNITRWGEWDAWAIWSQHAKFLSDADYFTNLFTNKIAWTHPDYPLMLPSLIAMVWKSFGNTLAIVPALLSYTIAFAMIVLIMSSFFEKKFWLSGVIITLLFSATSILFPYVLSQFSDTLLACFILLPFVVLNHLPQSKSVIGFILIGFLTATCVWIKNEGLMFFAIFSFCFAIKYYKERKIIGAYIIGMVFPLGVLAIFKIFFATPSDLLMVKTNYWEKLSDRSRYEFIINFAAEYFIQNAVLLLCLLIIVLFLNRRFYTSLPFVVIALLFLSYLSAYVVSPYGLQWHMSTSFDRLVHQIIPAICYAIFFSVSLKLSRSKNRENESLDNLPS